MFLAAFTGDTAIHLLALPEHCLAKPLPREVRGLQRDASAGGTMAGSALGSFSGGAVPGFAWVTGGDSSLREVEC